MGLWVYLDIEGEPNRDEGTGVFVRENGSNRELSWAEWDAKFPGIYPITSLPDDEDTEVFSANITHNLAKLASEANLYKYLWTPDETGIETAKDLIEPLQTGLDLLESDPERFAEFNPSNGWGDYDGLVRFVSQYLSACKEYPEATVHASR